MRYREYITSDRIRYPKWYTKEAIWDWLLSSEQHQIRRYLKYLRSEEYFSYYKPMTVLKYWYQRKRNRQGVKLGFFIHPGNFGLGLKIYHYGSIIVNPKARVGCNCTIHGNCCIGSKGGEDVSPTIGDNVDIGQNAQILGDICIADDVIVGAGAVVVKSCLQKGSVLAGVPAKPIK